MLYLISFHHNKACSLSILLGHLLSFHSFCELQTFTSKKHMGFKAECDVVSQCGDGKVNMHLVSRATAQQPEA